MLSTMDDLKESIKGTIELERDGTITVIDILGWLDYLLALSLPQFNLCMRPWDARKLKVSRFPLSISEE